MKKNAILLCMILFIIAGVSFFFLPDQIPIHYDITGVVDRYGNRMELFTIPFLSLALSAILILLEKADPKKDNIQRFKKAFYTVLFTVNLLMLIIMLIVIMESLYPKSIDVGMVLWITICMVFIVIGNLIPKFKSNSFMGIRTPWTLSNEQVWFKTHRFTGKIWFYGGIFMLFGIFLPRNTTIYLLIICTVLLGVIPCVYSYKCFKQQNDSQKG